MPNLTKKRNLTEFVSSVIRADADYFFGQRFINEDQYQRVLTWLNGREDVEIQRVVIGWLDSDSKYMAEVGEAAAKQLWYVKPVVILGLWILRNQLIGASSELKGVTMEEGGLISQLMPMKPDEGPPLPRILNLRWPKG